MERVKELIKTELDVEIISCVHGLVIIMVYAFLLWIQKMDNIDFVTLFIMLVLGYVMAWSQKAMFMKEKVFGKAEYRIRTAGWFVLPILEMVVCNLLFGWFENTAGWTEIVFDLVMIWYFGMFWWIIQWLYQGDSKEMNRLLERVKTAVDNRDEDGM